MFEAIVKEIEMIRNYKEEWTMCHIFNVWDEIKVEVTADLGLIKTPALSFDASRENSVMYVKHESIKEGMFGPIVETIPEYIIYINVEAVATKMIDILRVTHSLDAMDHMIRFFLLHECRHIWQAQTPFARNLANKKGAAGRFMDSVSLTPHGLKEQEMDANEYARSKAQDPREGTLAALETLCQGLRQGETNETYYHLVKEVKQVYRDDSIFRKHKASFLKSTVIAFTISSAALFAYLNSRKLDS